MATKTVLMCAPDYFEVAYEINAWMHKDNPVDIELAKRQWHALRGTYAGLGYQIEQVAMVDGLPDMVFTANGGLVIDGRVALPRFKHPERQGETPQFENWFRRHGYQVFLPLNDFEGEGDCLYAQGTLFAGSGYRTDIQSHAELAEFFGKPVVSLRQVDPRFYHLDVAMCPIDDDTVMYFPGAFDDKSRREIESRFKNKIVASEKDATEFGLNAVSDGKNVIMSADAKDLMEQVRQHGYNPIGMNMSEFRKSGGAVKCCTLELRAAVPAKVPAWKKLLAPLGA